MTENSPWYIGRNGSTVAKACNVPSTVSAIPIHTVRDLNPLGSLMLSPKSNVPRTVQPSKCRKKARPSHPQNFFDDALADVRVDRIEQLVFDVSQLFVAKPPPILRKILVIAHSPLLISASARPVCHADYACAARNDTTIVLGSRSHLCTKSEFKIE